MGSFVDEDYEEGSYEVQALMAGGRQERADVWAARKKEPAPARVRPSGEGSGPQRKVRQKPILEAQWQKSVREN